MVLDDVGALSVLAISIGAAAVVARRAGKCDESPALWFLITLAVSFTSFSLVCMFADFVPRRLKIIGAFVGLGLLGLLSDKSEEFDDEEGGGDPECDVDAELESEVEEPIDWIVLKTYVGNMQQFEFQNDINLLQKNGLNPKLLRGVMTSITLQESEIEQGIELLGVGVVDNDEEA